MLVAPESVYGTAWSTSATVVEHVAVVVREPADWLPPGRDGEAMRALGSEGEVGLVHHHEAFFNGSLILTTEMIGCARSGTTGSFLVAQRFPG